MINAVTNSNPQTSAGSSPLPPTDSLVPTMPTPPDSETKKEEVTVVPPVAAAAPVVPPKVLPSHAAPHTHAHHPAAPAHRPATAPHSDISSLSESLAQKINGTDEKPAESTATETAGMPPTPPTIDSTTSSDVPAAPPEKPKKKGFPLKTVLAALVFALVVIGGGATYWLTQTGQDIRQLATGGVYPTPTPPPAQGSNCERGLFSCGGRSPADCSSHAGQGCYYSQTSGSCKCGSGGGGVPPQGGGTCSASGGRATVCAGATPLSICVTECSQGGDPGDSCNYGCGGGCSETTVPANTCRSFGNTLSCGKWQVDVHGDVSCSDSGCSRDGCGGETPPPVGGAPSCNSMQLSATSVQAGTPVTVTLSGSSVSRYTLHTRADTNYCAANWTTLGETTGTYTWNTTGLAPGTYYIAANAYDTSNQWFCSGNQGGTCGVANIESCPSCGKQLIITAPPPTVNPAKPTLVVKGCITPNGTAQPAEFLELSWSDTPSVVQVVNINTTGNFSSGPYWNKDVRTLPTNVTTAPSGWGPQAGAGAFPVRAGKYYAYAWDGTRPSEVAEATVEVCPVVTPPPTAPICLNIKMYDSGGNLLTNYSNLKPGDRVKFGCGQVAGVTWYSFRVLELDSSGRPFNPNQPPLPSYPGALSTEYTIPRSGRFKAQCAICPPKSSNPFDVQCQPFEDVGGGSPEPTPPPTPVPAQQGCPPTYQCMGNSSTGITQCASAGGTFETAMIDGSIKPKYVCPNYSSVCCRPAGVAPYSGAPIPMPPLPTLPPQTSTCPTATHGCYASLAACTAAGATVDVALNPDTGTFQNRYQCASATQVCCKQPTAGSCAGVGGTCMLQFQCSGNNSVVQGSCASSVHVCCKPN